MDSNEFTLYAGCLDAVNITVMFTHTLFLIDQTYKSGGVVISDRLGISKGLQGRISLDDLIFQGSLLIYLEATFRPQNSFRMYFHNKPIV